MIGERTSRRGRLPGIALALLTAAALAAPAARCEAGGWVDITPPGGPLSELVVGSGPVPLLLVAHPALGLYRSTDGGESWTASGDDLRNPWGSTWVTALDLAVDGTRAAAGTRGSGLFISNDGGAEWRPSGIGFDLSVERITALRFDPRDAARLLIGTNAGLFQSVDAGQSVQRVHIPTGGRAPGTVVALAFHPSDSLRAYAALAPGGLFATSDGGASWVPAGAGLVAPPELLAFRRRNDTVALAATGAGLARWEAELRRWAPVGRGLPSHPPLSALVAQSGTPGAWLAGTRDGRLFGTTDDGATWRRLDAPVQPGPLLLASTAAGRLYLAGGGGLFVSDPAGAPWRPIEAGLPGFQPRLLIADATRPGRLLAGGGGGLRRSDDYGTTWQRLGDGLPPAAFPFGDLAAAPGEPRRIAGATDGGLVRSEDGGVTWGTTGLTRWTGGVTWPAASGGLLAVGGEGGTSRVWLSRDEGATWSETSQAPFDAGLWLATTDAGVFLAGSVLQRSDDGGGTWISLSLPPGTRRMTTLLGTGGGRLLGGTDRGLFASADRGATWTPIGLAGERIVTLLRRPEAHGDGLLLLSTRGIDVLSAEAEPRAHLDLPAALGGPLALAVDASGRVLYVAGEGGLYARELAPSAPSTGGRSR